MQPDHRALSSPPGSRWTFRPYLRQRLGAGRPHDRRPCWRSISGGLVRIAARAEFAGRCMRWEARGKYSHVQVDPFAPCRLRRVLPAFGSEPDRRRKPRYGHTNMRASELPSLSQAPCRSMRAWCDHRGEPAPGMAYSDRGRTQTKGCARSSGGYRAWQRLRDRSHHQHPGCADMISIGKFPRCPPPRNNKSG
jgi:hypothetical protein